MKIIRSMASACLVAAALLAPVAPAQADGIKAGDVLVRLRAIGVIPTGDGQDILPGLAGAGLDPRSSVVPELDFTYMFTDNIGVELILAISPHDFSGTGTISSLGKVADLMLLPPTLTLQYHFWSHTTIRPYIGAGINLTWAFAEDASSSLEAALGPTDIDAGFSVGPAFQAGVDFDIAENWFINIDLKYIMMDFDVDLTSGGVTRTIDVNVNPLIVGIGIGYKFSTGP